uniref:Uncharacterized protein n=1 Tax=Oryzias sinensis TaxID=183150 RepID=A0A8C7WUG1_9TELE
MVRLLMQLFLDIYHLWLTDFNDLSQVLDFIASRRSGRRNAIHEIPTEKLQGSMDLSQRLAQLRISKKEGDSESNQDSSAKEEEAQAEGS